MVAFGLRQQRFDSGTALRYLQLGETRVFGFDNAREIRR
jgi:hypothetical protein